MSRKPLAVVISDVHYSLNTLSIADKAFKCALEKAEELGVPLIDCGDLTNDKAILRAEVVNTLVETFAHSKVPSYCLIGNHSLINEKSKEHALNFLWPYISIIDHPQELDGFYFIPYQSNPDDFYAAIEQFPKDSIVFGHQGTIGGHMGDYIKDSSAIDPKRITDYRVFLGHYHRHYENGNTVSIGNPYTLTFGEAYDGPKGYLVVYDDGSYERIILPLRRHLIHEMIVAEDFVTPTIFSPKPDDIVWIKIRGTKSSLSKITKESFTNLTNFKLDLIPIEESIIKQEVQNKRPNELLDGIIDSLNEPQSVKIELKGLWKTLFETT